MIYPLLDNFGVTSFLWNFAATIKKLNSAKYYLLCSHSPNDIPHEPQWNVSIAVVLGTVHPSKAKYYHNLSLNI